MANTRWRSTTAVIIILILAIFAFLTPALFTAQDSPETTIFDQTEGTTVTLTTDLTASLNDVEAGENGTINVTLIDTETGETTTAENISVGETVTLTIGGESVDIGFQEKLSNSVAIISYEFPTYYGWPSGVKTLVQLMPAFPLIAFVLYLWFVAGGDTE